VAPGVVGFALVVIGAVVACLVVFGAAVFGAVVFTAVVAGLVVTAAVAVAADVVAAAVVEAGTVAVGWAAGPVVAVVSPQAARSKVTISDSTAKEANNGAKNSKLMAEFVFRGRIGVPFKVLRFFKMHSWLKNLLTPITSLLDLKLPAGDVRVVTQKSKPCFHSLLNQISKILNYRLPEADLFQPQFSPACSGAALI
jgi:hypothetical protein